MYSPSLSLHFLLGERLSTRACSGTKGHALPLCMVFPRACPELLCLKELSLFRLGTQYQEIYPSIEHTAINLHFPLHH